MQEKKNILKASGEKELTYIYLGERWTVEKARHP